MLIAVAIVVSVAIAYWMGSLKSTEGLKKVLSDWNPEWGYTFVYENDKIVGVLASCPYCGHQWVYKGGDKHTATCHGKIGGLCDHKVRLHPYLLNLNEKLEDYNPYNYGRTNRNKLKYPNRNYDHISKLSE